VDIEFLLKRVDSRLKVNTAASAKTGFMWERFDQGLGPERGRGAAYWLGNGWVSGPRLACREDGTGREDPGRIGFTVNPLGVNTKGG
jgi:hypothetical protein